MGSGRMKDQNQSTALARIMRHIELVRISLEKISQEFRIRGMKHDLSKFRRDEFQGFCRIGAAVEDHPYPSEEYFQAMKDNEEVVNLHKKRNSHHPEFHEEPASMNWLDIIEMVVDWRAAWEAYGSDISWNSNIFDQLERFEFTPEQEWLIREVAWWLQEDEVVEFPGMEE